MDARRTLEETTRIALDFLERESAGEPDQRLTPEEAARLPLDLPEHGLGAEGLFSRLEEVVKATPHTGGPRFASQLFGGRNLPALAGDQLAVVLNNSMYTYKAAGVHVLIEQLLIERLGSLVGFGHTEGTFTPGGSMSNLVAMLLARDVAEPEIRERGVREELVAYCSEEGHYSIAKNAGLLGIGRDNLRSVACDREGRMDPGALEETIGRDRAAGRQPFLVVATAGSTIRGVYDPLKAIGEVARAEDLWFHIDGAMGGSALLSERHRGLLEGSALADSFTWDAHKLLGVPLLCSAILVSRPGALAGSLHQTADYLFQTEGDEVNPGLRSLQCGRRNDSLKLWSMWQYHGTLGLAERIDRLFRLAEVTAQKVRDHPRLELVQDPVSVTVCLLVTGTDSKAICRYLDEQSILKVSWGQVGDRISIRLALVDPDRTEADIERWLDDIVSAADALASAEWTGGSGA